MAPIPPCLIPRKDQEVDSFANIPFETDLVCTKSIHFEEEPFKNMQSSRFMRVSSLSSEEESFQLPLQLLGEREECFHSLVSVMKTSVSSFTVCNNAKTLNTEVSWPGVSCGLDEDESRKKAKSKVALELEFVKKTAVENDDSSTSENFGSFSLFEYEKFTVKRSSQIQLKNEKCGKYFLVHVQFIASQEDERKANKVNNPDVGVIARACVHRGAKVAPSVS